jgi:hypothetical protein
MSNRRIRCLHLLEHVFVVVPGHHRHDRAEDLLLADAHRRRNLVKHHRRDEQARGERRISGLAAACEQLRRVFLGGFGKPPDAVELELPRRSAVVLLRPWRPDRKRLRQRHEFRDSAVMQGDLNE